ncbi:MAG: hypothetical protein ABII01_05040 [Candidatus Woesearchaeota archaeon]
MRKILIFLIAVLIVFVIITSGCTLPSCKNRADGRYPDVDCESESPGTCISNQGKCTGETEYDTHCIGDAVPINYGLCTGTEGCTWVNYCEVR